MRDSSRRAPLPSPCAVVGTVHIVRRNLTILQHPTPSPAVAPRMVAARPDSDSDFLGHLRVYGRRPSFQVNIARRVGSAMVDNVHELLVRRNAKLNTTAWLERRSAERWS
ncbi:hypothetical protein S40293_11254 [Stachybotrys chartarum IBT 40293]|nr:hypothetical protein S40293_11254 [Stachybotrys chartarum IBT 40293]